MPLFRVTVIYSASGAWVEEIEAEDEDHAYIIAEDHYADYDCDHYDTYDHSIHVENAERSTA
jgi:ABC-type molybdate transport system substrate-binding protein